MGSSRDDGSIDLREIRIALRHGWGVVAVGAIVGLGIGLAVTRLVPERYEGVTTVLVRASPDLASAALAGLGGVGDLIGGLGGGLASELSTELEILASRTVVGEVVDSLRLQAIVREPEGLPPTAIFERVYVAPGEPGRRYEVTRTAGGYRFEGEAVAVEAQPGVPAQLPGAEIVLRAGELPEAFTVDLLDREDAVGAVLKELRTSALTSDVAEITYRAPDPVTAAAVPNLVIEEYLARRRTTDRGTNQHRYEFLVAHTDSVTAELAAAEAALREHQEVSGVLDPQFAGETQVSRAMELQAELETIEVEARALQSVVDADRAGALAPRELAAFPTFLRNAAINDVLSRLLELETERVALLQRRTPVDDDVVALTQSIDNLETQLRGISQAYLSGLALQRTQILAELEQYRAVLDALPQQAEESLRREREVMRLSEIQLVLGAQLVQSRLAAIGEGGEVQQIDVAVPPKQPAFPSDGFILVLGLFGGLFFGTVGAVGSGLMRQRVREPWEAELATGVRATQLGSGGPLAIPEIRTARSLLLLPVGGGGAHEVGQKLVELATIHGREAVLADLTGQVGDTARRVPAVAGRPGENGDGMSSLVLDLSSGPVTLPLYHGGGGETAQQHRLMLGQLEERFPLVIAVLGGIDQPAALSMIGPDRPVVLVATLSEVSRSQLEHAVQTVVRFGGSVAGIVLGSPTSRRND